MKYKKTLLALCIAPIAIGAFAAANYVAGVFLFLLHRENPSRASQATMLQAIQSYEDRAARQKIVLSALAALALCVGGPALLVVAAMRQPDNGLYGRARFANRKDINAEGLDAPRGILLGKYKGEFLKLPGYEFALLAAPTRTGKGVGFVVPNLLTYEDSVVVLDIKGENYNLTSEFRRRYMGAEIVYWNPFSENSLRWNPLHYISSDPKFRVTGLMALASDIYPPNPKEPFWNDSAKNLFVGLALMVLETPALPKTIGEILRQGSGKGQAIGDYLHHIIELRAASDTPLSETCIDYLNRFLNNSDTVLKGVLSSFIAPLTIWGNPVIDKATSGSDFDFRDLRRKKVALYVHVPASEVKQAGFLLNLFFSQLINENVKELPEDNPDLKHQCLLLLDECTAMGKVEILAKGVGFMAGYNMRLVLIIQDKTQLESTYGKEDAHNILSNMGVVVYFTPSDTKEAEEYSKMIGTDTVKGGSLQYSNVGVMNARSSRSETQSTHSRALMLPQELRQMPKDKELIVRSGIPVIRAEKIRYFKDPFFLERLKAVPTRQVVVDSQPREAPIAVALPAANWRFYNTTIERSNYYLGDDFSDLSAAALEDESDDILLGLVNSPPEASSPARFDAAVKTLARRKAEEFMRMLNQDNSAAVATGPYRELVV
jgi:type IV secretion system protein VirD4